VDLFGRDTHPKAAAVQLDLLRRASIEQRAALALSLSATTIRLSRQALREAMPGATEAQVLHRWLTMTYGAELAARVHERLGPAAG
jgi:hypothetical protein